MTLKYKINTERGTKYIWCFSSAKEAEKAFDFLALENLKQEIEALGTKSVDSIKFYDDSNKLIEEYSSMHTLQTKIEIANQFKNGASYCLFVRT